MGHLKSIIVTAAVIAGMCVCAYLANQCSHKKSNTKQNYEEIAPVEESKVLPNELEVLLSSTNNVRQVKGYKTLEDF